MEWIALVAVLASAPFGKSAAQQDPLQGPITLAVMESLVEQHPPEMLLQLMTVGVYGCLLTIGTHKEIANTSIAITIDSIARQDICATAIGPASAYVPLALPPGIYHIRIARKQTVDDLQLRVTTTQLIVRPIGQLRFVRPDTTTFLRPAARTFLFSCGTPNIPELCQDLSNWIGHQPGIEHLPLASTDRIAFPRYSAYGYNDHQLFRFASRKALQRLIRCIRHVADTLSTTVGAGIVLRTSDGDMFQAASNRSLEELHSPVPRKVSGSSDCP